MKPIDRFEDAGGQLESSHHEEDEDVTHQTNIHSEDETVPPEREDYLLAISEMMHENPEWTVDQVASQFPAHIVGYRVVIISTVGEVPLRSNPIQ